MAILYGHPESGHTYKVALALELAGVAFEYRWVDVFKPREQRAADFQAASRHGEIPVLVDGAPLVQSNAILLHLAGKHRTLGGESQATMDLAREWLFWEANRIGISLPNLRHYLRFDDSPAPPAGVLDWLRGRLQSDLQRLEKELSGNTWLLGAVPSVADIACFAYLGYDDIGLDLCAFPGLRGWMSRLRALPRWRPPHELLARPA